MVVGQIMHCAVLIAIFIFFIISAFIQDVSFSWCDLYDFSQSEKDEDTLTMPSMNQLTHMEVGIWLTRALYSEANKNREQL